jgi:multiple RNA-binding domain-containing protein 1
MTTPTVAASSAPANATTTTRICIKNLHPSFDETKLKSHLRNAQPCLHITDCKLLKTADGKSRKIAFVGFQTASQAESAVSYFDKSFAGTARLSVSLAFSKKKNHHQQQQSSSSGASEYRPWSKHSKGSSRYAKLHQQKEELNEERISAEIGNKKSKLGVERDVNVDEEAVEANRKREEFLSAMGVSTSSTQGGKASKSKFWANDDANVECAEDQRPKNDDNDDGNDNKDDSYSHHSSSSSSIDSDSDDEFVEESITDKRNEVKNNASSDLDFLRSKQVKAEILTDESDVEDEQDEDDCDSSSSSCKDDSSSESDASSEDKVGGDKIKSDVGVQIHGSGALEASDKNGDKKAPAQSQPSNTLHDRLFVRNLPFTTTEEDLYEKFTEFGHVTAVHIPVDDSKRNKGYAFINFEHCKDAKQAMDTMDGEDFQGRLIHILPAKPSADLSNDVDESNLTFKERQALARRKEAEKSTNGWSSSFLRGDAVVDNLSERLGVSKGDILNVKDGISSGNAAVRLALGETHIISENIAFFESHGVDATALDSKTNRNSNTALKRSKKMILVKNLPYDTSLEDLTKVFQGIGGDAPQQILLPPSKTAALVEYGHSTDARRAFRSLAYKKFKHVPLYLEWAPMMAVDNEEPPKDDMIVDTQKMGGSDLMMKSKLVEEDPTMEAVDTRGGSQTVYVKNLNFSTTEATLEMAFTRSGFHPRAVKIPTKSAPLAKAGASAFAESSGNRHLSMGFGFVEFPAEEVALKAIKAMQGKFVDGHALEIKLSTKTLSASMTPATDKTSKNTKIIVRNVPFEASRTELLQLFGSFGQLKKVRLPKKFDGSHRGFAFCEFLTSKEAQNAMTTLSRTHLYGRHLVLEWAEASDEDGKVDVDAIREKSKRDVMLLGGNNKKRKHTKF